MPTVISYTNAYPGAAFPQHLTGKTATVQSYVYPGAVEPFARVNVLSYTNAFPNGPFPQHLTGKTATVQAYVFPGAVQPKPLARRARGIIFGDIGLKWIIGVVIAKRTLENPDASRRDMLLARWWLVP